MRVLVIEDDANVAGFITKALKEAGHTPVHADNGTDGLFLATTEEFDALIVDRMLPGPDGLTIIRTLRASENNTPALILSALGEVSDKVKGLNVGADDYITKPFAAAELLARMDALNRRAKTGKANVLTTLTVGDLKMDLLAHSVHRDYTSIDLKPREFRLLEFLMRNSGSVVTRTMLLENVWEYHFDPQTNVIDVHISRLRQKIDRDFETTLIHTVRGAGYVIRVDQ